MAGTGYAGCSLNMVRWCYTSSIYIKVKAVCGISADSLIYDLALTSALSITAAKFQAAGDGTIRGESSLSQHAPG
ncbi:MAG: hypothetical protein OCU22_04285 [Canidatus Methanoxibalbensis ujae]|nr:hypothetical protein [Candidatus Methanoxibalbensis ujae]